MLKLNHLPIYYKILRAYRKLEKNVTIFDEILGKQNQIFPIPTVHRFGPYVIGGKTRMVDCLGFLYFVVFCVTVAYGNSLLKTLGYFLISIMVIHIQKK